MRRISFLCFLALLALSVGVSWAQDAAPEATAAPIAGALQVAQVLPADDSSGVDADLVITVIFNRPVVPLGVAEAADTLPQPLAFAPAVQGKGEWLNTSIYVFRPDPALQGGTTYTVTVSDLTAVDGSTLAEPFAWSFTTAAPLVSDVIPSNTAMDVLLDATVQVRFNQPMNRESVEASFSLYPFNQPDAVVPGKFTWADDGAGFRFFPDENLTIDTQYVVAFSEPLPVPEGGGAALEGAAEWGFSTIPLPSLLSTDPFDGQTDAYPDYGITLSFASPMDVETLEEHVTIEPAPIREYDTYYSDYSNSFTLSFPAEPSTSYTITITPGMKDVYGNEITTGRVIHYTTAPYQADISLQVPGTIGFYNADNEKTQLFLTHRNVSRINLSLFGVELEDFVRGVTGETY